MLASLNVLLERHAAEPSAYLAEQIRSITDTMNGWEQPAKQLLDSAHMPAELRYSHFDAWLRKLCPDGSAFLGLAIAMEPGVSWADVEGAYVLHFRGNKFHALKPGAAAGTLTRFSTGQLLEPVIRVMDNCLDSAVEDGLMAANANVAAMDVNPLVLQPQSEGKLPECLSSEEEAEAYRIAQIHVELCLCRLAIAQLPDQTEESLDRIAIEHVTQGKPLPATTTDLPKLPMQRYGKTQASPLAVSFGDSVAKFPNLNLSGSDATHPQGLSADFKGPLAYLRMANSDRQEFGTLTAQLCARIGGVALQDGAHEGYGLSYIQDHANTVNTDAFLLAAQTRARISAEGIAAPPSNDRTAGDDAGTLKADPAITGPQRAALFSSTRQPARDKINKGSSVMKHVGKGTSAAHKRINKKNNAANNAKKKTRPPKPCPCCRREFAYNGFSRDMRRHTSKVPACAEFIEAINKNSAEYKFAWKHTPKGYAEVQALKKQRKG